MCVCVCVCVVFVRVCCVCCVCCGVCVCAVCVVCVCVCVSVCLCVCVSGRLTHLSLLTEVCTFDSLPHFIPLIEFRDRIDHWKWIGQFYCVLWILVCHHLTWCAGQDRDSEVELLVLCNHWLETLDRALVRGGALGVARGFKGWSIGCG